MCGQALATEAFMTGVRIMGETSRQKVGRQGVATANNGGIFYALVRGFAGLEISEKGVMLCPVLPSEIKSLRFKTHYRGLLIEFNISADRVIVKPQALAGNTEVPRSMSIIVLRTLRAYRIW